MAKFRIVKPTSVIVDNVAIAYSEPGGVVELDEAVAAGGVEAGDLELIPEREEFEQVENHAVVAGDEAVIVDGPVTDDEVSALAAMRTEAEAAAGAEAYAEAVTNDVTVTVGEGVPGATGTSLDGVATNVINDGAVTNVATATPEATTSAAPETTATTTETATAPPAEAPAKQDDAKADASKRTTTTRPRSTGGDRS